MASNVGPSMPFLRMLLSLLRLTVLLGIVGTIALGLFVATRRQPADLPWTPLDPGAPPGLTTRAKLNALAGSPARCHALLARAGIAYRALPGRTGEGGSCGFDDGVAWTRGGARAAAYAPAAPALACPLAATLAVWEWSVVQPAAARRLGTTVTRIDHFGSYACRRIYGRASGDWSEHARADAIDVAGFRLADGRRITVARDWKGGDDAAAFLHEVREGGCRLFGTTLSPDYNAAHRDHLHLDGARRGGWGFCR